MVMNATNFVPRLIVIRFSGGDLTVLRLVKPRRNSGLKDADFEVRVPARTEIIDYAVQSDPLAPRTVPSPAPAP